MTNYSVEVTLRGTETVTMKYGSGSAAKVIGIAAQLIADYENNEWTELLSITLTKEN